MADESWHGRRNPFANSAFGIICLEHSLLGFCTMGQIHIRILILDLLIVIHLFFQE